MARFVYAVVGIVFVLGSIAVGAQNQDAARQAGGREEVPDVVKVFALEHASAEEMQRIVDDLFGRRDLRADGFARAGGSRTSIRTSSDSRTNSFIVVGPQGELAVIEALMRQLDTAPLEEAVNARQIAVQRAQAALRQGEAVAKNTLLQQETQVAEAARQIELARLQLTECQQGTCPLHLKVLQKEIQQAKRELEEHKQRVEAGKADGKSLEGPTVELDVAETRLRVFEEYTATRTIKDLENVVASAERALQLERRQTQADVKTAQAGLASQRAHVDVEIERLKRLQNDLTKCKILAPHDGVVTAAGPQPLREGSQVRERQVVLILTK